MSILLPVEAGKWTARELQAGQGEEQEPVRGRGWTSNGEFTICLDSRKGAGVSVGSSPGTGAGDQGPKPFTPKHTALRLTLGWPEGDRISQTFKELTAAGKACSELSSASKTRYESLSCQSL